MDICITILFYKVLTSNAFVIMQEAQSYAQENGLFFMETSAKTAINVNDIFYEIGNLFRILVDLESMVLFLLDVCLHCIVNNFSYIRIWFDCE